MARGFKALGGQFQVNSEAMNDQIDSSVANLNDGGFIVTWSSLDQDGSASGIFGQRYDASGVILGAEFQVNTQTMGYQNGPSIATLNGGDFVVFWSSSYFPDHAGIFGQRYDATGVALGAKFQVNVIESTEDSEGSAIALKDGGFVVTWTSVALSSGGIRMIHARKYDATGVPAGDEIIVHPSPDDQILSSVTALKDGSFLITWSQLPHTRDDEDTPENRYDIYGQRYDAVGSTVGPKFWVNTELANTQIYSSVTTLSDGGLVFTWTSTDQDGSGRGIFGQRYDASGVAVGNEFQVNTEWMSTQYQSSVTALDNGGFVVTWTSEDLDGSGYGIFAQQFQAQLFGTAEGEAIFDTFEAGWIHGQGGNDLLRGLKGSDIIFGGSGRDTLKGGQGKDVLKGGHGKDTLDGGKGNDKLHGGRGMDEFVFKDGSDKDKIMDFQDDFDTIRLDQDLWGGGLTKQQMISTYASIDGDDIVFVFGTNELRIKGFADLTELSDDIVFI